MESFWLNSLAYSSLCAVRLSFPQHYDHPASNVLRSALPSSLQPVDDLLKLEELHEGAILNNLRMRYQQDDIYTYISNIVLSVNPYKQLPCYGPSQIALYRNALAANRSGTSAPSAGDNTAASSTSSDSSSSSSASPPSSPASLPPHVYALADEAYTSLLRDQVNQAILISGESGAGSE